jgi:hypothetical protein
MFHVTAELESLLCHMDSSRFAWRGHAITNYTQVTYRVQTSIRFTQVEYQIDTSHRRFHISISHNPNVEFTQIHKKFQISNYTQVNHCPGAYVVFFRLGHLVSTSLPVLMHGSLLVPHLACRDEIGGSS